MMSDVPLEELTRANRALTSKLIRIRGEMLKMMQCGEELYKESFSPTWNHRLPIAQEDWRRQFRLLREEYYESSVLPG